MRKVSLLNHREYIESEIDRLGNLIKHGEEALRKNKEQLESLRDSDKYKLSGRVLEEDPFLEYSFQAYAPYWGRVNVDATPSDDLVKKSEEAMAAINLAVIYVYTNIRNKKKRIKTLNTLIITYLSYSQKKIPGNEAMARMKAIDELSNLWSFKDHLKFTERFVTTEVYQKLLEEKPRFSFLSKLLRRKTYKTP